MMPPKAAFHWLIQKNSPQAIVLQYHRVAELPSDPHVISTTPQHFEEQLLIVREHFQPVALQDLVQSLRVGALPHRAVAITFDDGYADNLYNAKPLLERYDLPATFFLTTGYLDGGREFWWDELDHLLLQPGRLPETLQLVIKKIPYHWELGENAFYDEASSTRLRAWNLGWKTDPGSRQAIFRSLYHLLHGLPQDQRQEVLASLHDWSGMAPEDCPHHQILSCEEVLALASGDLMELGAHTVTHPVLPGLPSSEQRAEISQGKADLERILNRTVNGFSYPHGSGTAETHTAVSEAGFMYACSNLREPVRRGAKRFQIPRLRVKDWNGVTFKNWLETWVRG
jgi:peptidoglycan/xylan/chitin deacetylase (PgdA/CDA1 family)